MSEREELAYRRGRKCERDEFKNFHRLLCERFGYTHDEVDWKRDQISLIEWIARRTVSGQEADICATCAGSGFAGADCIHACFSCNGSGATPIPATELLREIAELKRYDPNGIKGRKPGQYFTINPPKSLMERIDEVTEKS